MIFAHKWNIHMNHNQSNENGARARLFTQTQSPRTHAANTNTWANQKHFAERSLLHEWTDWNANVKRFNQAFEWWNKESHYKIWIAVFFIHDFYVYIIFYNIILLPLKLDHIIDVCNNSLQ